MEARRVAIAVFEVEANAGGGGEREIAAFLEDGVGGELLGVFVPAGEVLEEAEMLNKVQSQLASRRQGR